MWWSYVICDHMLWNTHVICAYDVHIWNSYDFGVWCSHDFKSYPFEMNIIWYTYVINIYNYRYDHLYTQMIQTYGFHIWFNHMTIHTWLSHILQTNYTYCNVGTSYVHGACLVYLRVLLPYSNYHTLHVWLIAWWGYHIRYQMWTSSTSSWVHVS